MEMENNFSRKKTQLLSSHTLVPRHTASGTVIHILYRHRLPRVTPHQPCIPQLTWSNHNPVGWHHARDERPQMLSLELGLV